MLTVEREILENITMLMAFPVAKRNVFIVKRLDPF
jgi:hypothetical protein